MLKAEVVDFNVYADTLEAQLREVLSLLKTGDKVAMCAAAQLLDGIVNGPDEG